MLFSFISALWKYQVKAAPRSRLVVISTGNPFEGSGATYSRCYLSPQYIRHRVSNFKPVLTGELRRLIHDSVFPAHRSSSFYVRIWDNMEAASLMVMRTVVFASALRKQNLCNSLHAAASSGQNCIWWSCGVGPLCNEYYLLLSHVLSFVPKGSM